MNLVRAVGKDAAHAGQNPCSFGLFGEEGLARGDHTWGKSVLLSCFLDDPERRCGNDVRFGSPRPHPVRKSEDFGMESTVVFARGECFTRDRAEFLFIEARIGPDLQFRERSIFVVSGEPDFSQLLSGVVRVLGLGRLSASEF